MIVTPHLSSLDVAVSWVVTGTTRLAAEAAPLRSAHCRILAEDIFASHPIPMTDCAALDGFAVAAGATVGASSLRSDPVRTGATAGARHRRVR
jgi:molybdopterin biosynthesis enzyme